MIGLVSVSNEVFESFFYMEPSKFVNDTIKKFAAKKFKKIADDLDEMKLDVSKDEAINLLQNLKPIINHLNEFKSECERNKNEDVFYQGLRMISIVNILFVDVYDIVHPNAWSSMSSFNKESEDWNILVNGN